MAHNIYHNLVIKASKEAIFDAFTQPEHLNNWWTLSSSGEPKLEAEYNLNFTESYDWYAKVSEVEHNETFYLKMTKADDDWNPTTFGFQLTTIEKGTLVAFSHTGWREANHHFKHTSFCWALLLNALKNYLEKDIIVPFKARE